MKKWVGVCVRDNAIRCLDTDEKFLIHWNNWRRKLKVTMEWRRVQSAVCASVKKETKNENRSTGWAVGRAVISKSKDCQLKLTSLTAVELFIHHQNIVHWFHAVGIGTTAYCVVYGEAKGRRRRVVLVMQHVHVVYSFWSCCFQFSRLSSPPVAASASPVL